MNKLEEVMTILSESGPAFSGGFPESCEGLAEEWLDEFDDDVKAIRAWVEAGYWDAATASTVAHLGYTPRHTPKYKEKSYDNMTPIYALCNNDISVSELIWE